MMNTTEALRAVEAILGQFKSLYRLQEVLQVVQSAEIRLAELENEYKKVQAEKGAFEETQRIVFAEKLREAEDLDSKIWSATGELQSLIGKVDKIKAEIDSLTVKNAAKVAEADAYYNGLISKNEKKLADLQTKIVDEENRLALVQAKIAELKGM